MSDSRDVRGEVNMTALANWWDGVEEWLTGLSFVPQLLVTLIVVIPLAVLIAAVLNVLVDTVSTLIDRRRFADDDGTGL